MGEDFRKKLEAEVEMADWSMLAPHFARGVVFLVDRSEDLVNVGVAFAENDVERVKSWQERLVFRPPSDSEVELWSKDLTKKFAKFIIVQPFVLIQAIETLH